MRGERATGRTTEDLERMVAALVERAERRFFGKYRGRVVDTDDPLRLGRLRVSVPSVLGPDVVTGWATPCAPYGGAAGQGLLLVPDREAGVWVEFEEGDPEFPIWCGTFWSKPSAGSEVPKPNQVDGAEADEPQAVPSRKTFKTRKGHTWQFEDADGAEVVLLREGVKGHRIVLDADGITVSDATGNTIALTRDAVTITAKKPLTIDASGQPIRIVGKSIALEQG